MSLINTTVKPFKTTAYHNGNLFRFPAKIWLANGLFLYFIQRTLLLFAQLN
jgi:hypothetical protein